MALTLRVLTNSTGPFNDIAGNPLVGVEIAFKLVDVNGLPVQVFDTTSGECVIGFVKAITDATGVFSASLWPNDRSTTITQYQCTSDLPGFQTFQSTLPSGVGSYSWATFHG